MAAAAGLGPDDRQIVALMSRFSASRFTAQAARHQATHASLFAAPIRMILARSQGQPRRLDSVRP
jgi:crotonobetaine/carnitine-CoA ligase